jgi:PAS domain S-box-containing protein
VNIFEASQSPLLLLLPLLLAIFVLDLTTPEGYAVWIIYLGPILLTYRLPQPRALPIVVAACTALVILAYFLSPIGTDPRVSGFNRSLGIAAAWMLAALLVRHKRTEELVQKSEQRLRDLIDGLGPNMFVGMIAPDGTLIAANKSALAIAGLKPEDVLGKPLTETYWVAYSDEAKHRFREAIERAARGEPSRYDVPIRASESRFIVIDFFLQPMRDETGRIVCLVASASDITERKRAEEALRESEKRFRQVTENIHEVFWMTDPTKNQMLYVSPAYEDIWGRTCASLYASPRAWIDAIHPDNRERVLQAATTKPIGSSGPTEPSGGSMIGPFRLPTSVARSTGWSALRRTLVGVSRQSGSSGHHDTGGTVC